jgi:hypothetical protein
MTESYGDNGVTQATLVKAPQANPVMRGWFYAGLFGPAP